MRQQVETAKQLERTGNPADLRRALALYRAAARDDLGRIYLYQPPVGRNGRGQVISVPVGTPRMGDAEARYRLGLLYRDGRGVRRNPKRAEKLLRSAAAHGFIPE